MLHCLQLLPHTPHRDAECHKYMNLNPGQKEVGSRSLHCFAAARIFGLSQQYFSTYRAECLMLLLMLLSKLTYWCRS